MTVSFKSLKNPVLAFALAAAAGALGFSGTASAQGHSYINYMRSGTTTSVFMQQSIDGEYGRYAAKLLNTDEDGNETTTDDTQFWKGYGIGTTIGIETMKFVQVVVGHTFVNMRSRDDGTQSLDGSRLNAGLRLSFLSPVGNLEAGGGILGSRLDYRKMLDTGSFYGSGVYYSLGLNYFMSMRVSVYFEAKIEDEHLVRNGGSAPVESIDRDSTLMGLGVRIWL